MARGCVGGVRGVLRWLLSAVVSIPAVQQRARHAQLQFRLLAAGADQALRTLGGQGKKLSVDSSEGTSQWVLSPQTQDPALPALGMRCKTPSSQGAKHCGDPSAVDFKRLLEGFTAFAMTGRDLCRPSLEQLLRTPLRTGKATSTPVSVGLRLYRQCSTRARHATEGQFLRPAQEVRLAQAYRSMQSLH